MSKLKLQMQISVDGFVATGPNDDRQWVTLVWDEIKQYVIEISDTTEEKLIDEFHLFVNPVALGKGVPIFSELGELQNLDLKKLITYHSGLVLLNYELS